jgi:hypothetical protein
MLLLLLLLSCADPQPLPTEVAAEALDRSSLPPLYRQLYDYAFLPEVQGKEQRVRLLIWLKYMEFSRYQLGLMRELADRTERERRSVEERQREIVREYEPKIGAVYDQVWEGIQAGASEDELAKLATELAPVREREAELLELRSRSVRTLFETQAPFLKTLTATQEIRFSDATFLLRHRLDPYANPGDFNALIGTVYVAGQFGALSRPTFDPGEDHLNIGGLWSEEPEQLAGPYFPDARREVILYMVLLEPRLGEAIEAALKLKATEPEPGVPGDPGVVPGATPPPGVPTDPPPGIPEAPPPGQPAPE